MIAVIGDIHGSIRSLDILVNTILKKHDVSKFIVLGDFVDRGKNSLEVTKLLISLGESHSLKLLRGNHEDMLIDYIRNEKRYHNYSWNERIGLSAITSFTEGKVTDVTDISRNDIYCYFAPYMPFIESSNIYLSEVIGGNNFLFSHAGIEFNNVLPEKQCDNSVPTERAINYPFLWSRQIMKFEKRYFDYIVVHGHIPLFTRKGGSKKPLVRKDKKGEVININLDTGCVYGGTLTAMLIDYAGQYDFEIVRCMD